jgi:HD-GYP domain-containing protein (c-di-GMP phosphodiesterase class II)
MSSTRTYRSALSRRQVLDEIAKCTGAQFDPALAKVFVKLDFSEFDRMVREHQAQETAVSGQRSAAGEQPKADSRKLNADRSAKEAA